MNELTNEELVRLRKLLQHEGLEKFLPYADQAAAEAKLNAARRLIWRTYRQMFVAFAGAILAGVTFWETLTRFISSILTGANN